MTNDIYLEKIRELRKNLDELDTELIEYRNRQIKLENKLLQLIEELYNELLKRDFDGLTLVRENVYRYNAYQFFVDNNGKRYIKYIDYDEDEGVIVFTFSEDDTISSIKDKLPKEEYGIVAQNILAMFCDEDIWKRARKDE